ncbi:lytic transglycosylase [Anaerolentibacter hominis]|uniref:lytic transglycosylase n=1 Tax=Anaerolentibacter hominis TaxID=3079009 RepID=UPI0031B856DD
MDNSQCKGLIYTVQEGDTLYLISRRYNVPLGYVLKANPLVDIYNLRPGQKICIPGIYCDLNKPMASCPLCSLFSYEVKAGDSIKSILDDFGIELDDLFKYNKSAELYLKEGIRLQIPDKNK